LAAQLPRNLLINVVLRRAELPHIVAVDYIDVMVLTRANR